MRTFKGLQLLKRRYEKKKVILFFFNVQWYAITKIITRYVHFENFIFNGLARFINNYKIQENSPIRSKAESTFELGCTFEQDEVGIYIDQKNNIYSLQSSLITDKS